MATGEVLGRGDRQPAVATDAAVPAHAVDLAGDELVGVAEGGGVEADQLVPGEAADQQLVVEPGAEAARALDAG